MFVRIPWSSVPSVTTSTVTTNHRNVLLPSRPTIACPSMYKETSTLINPPRPFRRRIGPRSEAMRTDRWPARTPAAGGWSETASYSRGSATRLVPPPAPGRRGRSSRSCRSELRPRCAPGRRHRLNGPGSRRLPPAAAMSLPVGGRCPVRSRAAGRCCMKTLRGWGGVARTSLDAPQEPHDRDEVEGPSHVYDKVPRCELAGL